MNKHDILQTIRNLANSSGFYSRLNREINEMSCKERDEFLTMLENQSLEDEVDLILYLEA